MSTEIGARARDALAGLSVYATRAKSYPQAGRNRGDPRSSPIGRPVPNWPKARMRFRPAVTTRLPVIRVGHQVTRRPDRGAC